MVKCGTHVQTMKLVMRQIILDLTTSAGVPSVADTTPDTAPRLHCLSY